jgi:hypothetical protein
VFQASCDTDQWFIGLIGEISFTRAFAELSDDQPVAWTVRLDEVSEKAATVLLSVGTLAGRSLDLLSRTWAPIEGEWWFDDPPSEVCRQGGVGCTLWRRINELDIGEFNGDLPHVHRR